MKQCKKCLQDKPILEYFNRKDTKDGKHIYCKSCLKVTNDKWYQNSKGERSDYYKTYREDNKAYYNNYSHNHYHTNKELYREWNREKYATDLGFKLKHVTSARINQALKLYHTLKTARTIEYLGCNIEEYALYLEKQFDGNMNWDNYGEYWEIDHIKPIDAFDLNLEEELYAAFHYKNTQPLSKIENRVKSNMYQQTI
jgi:hypothetical protein